MTYNLSYTQSGIGISRISLFLVFVFFQIGTINAQKFEVGAKAAGSYNNTYVMGLNTYRSQPVYGGSVGAFGTFQLFEKFKVRAEVLATMRGFTADFSSSGAGPSLYSGYQVNLPSSSTGTASVSESYTATLKQQTLYLDVPVGVDYKLFEGIYLQGGAMMSIFMKEMSSSYSNNSSVGVDQPQDAKYYQYYQFSIFGGAYYQFPFKLTAGARVNMGLTNTYLQLSHNAGNQFYPYSYQIFVTYPLIKF